MRHSWLPPVWVGVVLAGLEAWTLLLVVGNSGQLVDLGAITIGTILFMHGVEGVNRDQQDAVRSRRVQALGVALLLFLLLTFTIARRQESGDAVWIWAELGALALLSLPTYAVGKFLVARIGATSGS
ncbi:MAG: hypothetical protein WD556_07765 [Actinomycetota bacterium]